VPRFEPFAGVRYDTDIVDLSDVVAPPYDVIDDAHRGELQARSPYNAVRVELPQDDATRSRYESADCTFREWQAAGVLLTDDEPAFYGYRMGFHDEHGRARQTSGVIGALELSHPGEAGIMPHERTLSKARDDRLNMLRTCRANLSPVWMLSLATGLSGLCEVAEPPIARCTDEDGVHHRLWRLTAPGLVDAIRSAVASTPLVIADGHHRFETAVAYRDERRATDGGTAGEAELIMALVVELVDEQIDVHAIHRLVSGLPAGADVPALLDPWFEPFESAGDMDTLPDRMADAGALGLVLPSSTWLLRPRSPAEHDVDSARLAPALDALPSAGVSFQADPAKVAAAVAAGQADAGVLLRPAPVAQIASTALDGWRMPEKTTYFAPKPRTGMVFRRL
jgi:uncharacterized protein (DUF1015 family)